MDELCPLCLKMGNNKRIKAIQVNLEEAVWMCENEKCPWPFGYGTPVFLPRKVGLKHSNEWEVYKKVEKRVGPIPVSTELSLYTPPVTPSSDTTTKDSTKSDFSGETNNSEHSNQMGNILGCTNDSYAPKSSLHENFLRNVNKKETEVLNALVENKGTTFCTELQKSPIPQSIFDIDNKESPSDKIIIKDFSSESKKPEVSLASLEIADVKNPEKHIETVLKAFDNEVCRDVNLEKLEKLEDKEKEIVLESMEDTNAIKTTLRVTKISDAKIDLQMIDHRKIVTIKNSVETKEEVSSEKTKVDLTKTFKNEDSPMEIDDNNHESDVLTKSPSLDDTKNSKHHTTTITVDGSLPITLSYDLTDLEEKSECKISQTSSPVRKNSMESSYEEKAENTPMKSPVELAKKRIRPPAKRRATSTGKQYEKFSFSALKKCSARTKDCGDESSRTIDSSNERVKVEQSKIVKVEHCSVGVPDNSVKNRISDASNQPVDLLNMKNVDPTDSGKINDDPIDDNLNLSVLDDLLIDGYQNVTTNLNDDWLESFFTTLDT